MRIAKTSFLDAAGNPYFSAAGGGSLYDSGLAGTSLYDSGKGLAGRGSEADPPVEGGGGAPLLLTLPQDLPQHDALAGVGGFPGGGDSGVPVQEMVLLEAGAPLALALPPMEMEAEMAEMVDEEEEGGVSYERGGGEMAVGVCALAGGAASAATCASEAGEEEEGRVVGQSDLVQQGRDLPAAAAPAEVAGAQEEEVQEEVQEKEAGQREAGEASSGRRVAHAEVEVEKEERTAPPGLLSEPASASTSCIDLLRGKLPPFLKLTDTDPFAAWFLLRGAPDTFLITPSLELSDTQSL